MLKKSQACMWSLVITKTININSINKTHLVSRRMTCTGNHFKILFKVGSLAKKYNICIFYQKLKFLKIKKMENWFCIFEFEDVT